MFKRKQVFYGKKVEYFLLPVTSCWRHISVFANDGFYRREQTFDQIYVSQQGFGSHKFAKDVSQQWTDN